MARPRPVPLVFVVWNAWKSTSGSTSPNPVPQSAMSI